MEYYPRKIEKELEPWLKRKEIIVIKGARQTGKTTLLQYLRQKLGGVYLTLEDDEIKEALEKDPKTFVNRFGKKQFLFLDEAQYLKNIGKILKLIFDLQIGQVKLFVSGSGSFDLKVKVSKYLVGRAVFFELYPLGFEEFLLWKNKELYKIFLGFKEDLLEWLQVGRLKVKPVFEKEFLRHLEEFLIFGGFPAIVKEKNEQIKKKLLQDLTKTYLERDIFFFLGIRHLEKFRDFLKALAFTSGSLLNLSHLSSDLKIDYKTLTEYLDILISTYIVFPVRSFHQNLVTELKKTRKIYFLDTGLRNSLLGNFLPWGSRGDAGVLWESYIFQELRQNFVEIKYWRTSGGAEVDFIVEKEGTIFPIEVKTQGRLKRGFFSFLKNYVPSKAIIFSLSEFKQDKRGKTEMLFCPPFFI